MEVPTWISHYVPSWQHRVVSVARNLPRETCAIHYYSCPLELPRVPEEWDSSKGYLPLQSLFHYSSASSHHASRVQSRTAVHHPLLPSLPLPNTALETGSALTPSSQSTWLTLPFPGQDQLPCQSGSVSKFLARDKRL